MPKLKAGAQSKSQSWIKDPWPYPNQDQFAETQSETSSVHQSSKWGLKGHECSLPLKFKIQSPNLDNGCIKDQWSYQNQDQDATPPSGASSIVQSPKWGLKRHGSSLYLHNQDREPKFGSFVYQRQITMYKSRSRWQTLVRNLQHPPKPQIRTLRTWMFLAPPKNHLPWFWNMARFYAFLSKTNLSKNWTQELSFSELTFLSQTNLNQN